MTKKAENMKASLDKFVDYYVAAKGVKPDIIRIPKKDEEIFKKEINPFDVYKGVKVALE